MVWAADPARGAGQQAGKLRAALRDTRALGPPGCRRWARDVPRPEGCLAKEAVPAGRAADPGRWASVERGVRTTPRSSRSSGLPAPARPRPSLFLQVQGRMAVPGSTAPAAQPLFCPTDPQLGSLR